MAGFGGGIWTLFGNITSEVQMSRDVKEEITWSWVIPHIMQLGRDLTVLTRARSNIYCPCFESSVVLSLN